MSRPCVLLVGPVPAPAYGMAVATAYLKTTLAELGHPVHHLDTSNRRGLEWIGKFDWPNTVLATRHFWQFLRAVIHGRGPVIVPLNLRTTALVRDCVWILLAALLGRPVVIQIHGSAIGQRLQKSSLPIRWLLRWTHRQSRLVLVLTEKLRDAYEGVVPREQVCALALGVPDPSAGYSAREQSDDVQVLHLGTLSREKGTLLLVEAAAILRGRGWKGRIVVVGKFLRETDRKWCMERIDREGMRELFSFPGEADEAQRNALMAMSHIFVLTPLAPEGQPLVLLEAMASRLAIITSDSGGIVETVDEGRGAMLLPEVSAPFLAEAIWKLSSDLLFRQEMSRASRRLYEERYTLDHFRARLGAAMDRLRG